MASFLSNLFSGSSEPKGSTQEKTRVLPPDNFSILKAEQEGRVVLGSVNKAYKGYDRKSEFPWCLHIGIVLAPKTVQDNGLPDTDETYVANQLEDELLAEIKKLETAHYIGHLFNEGFLDVYIYLAEPQKVHDYLQTQIKKEGLVRGFGYEINKDPEWALVSPFLA